MSEVHLCVTASPSGSLTVPLRLTVSPTSTVVWSADAVTIGRLVPAHGDGDACRAFKVLVRLRRRLRQDNGAVVVGRPRRRPVRS